MSCNKCNSATNAGRAICLYCGCSTLGASKSKIVDIDLTLSKTANENANENADYQNENQNRSSASDFQEGNQNWNMPQAPTKDCVGFTYGIIAIVGGLFVPLLAIIFGILAIVSGKRGKKANENRAGAAIILGTIAVSLVALLFLLVFATLALVFAYI